MNALAPKIQWFAAYHRHTCCSETFSRVVYEMFRQLWLWACRRHPSKSLKWVARRYWRPVDGNGCVFGTKDHCLAPITCQHVVSPSP